MEHSPPQTPPHATEAEQVVLGAMLMNNEHFDLISTLINESDFYHQDHRFIFAEISLLLNDNREADCVIVAKLLEEKNRPLQNETLGYLESLVEFAKSASASLNAYSKLIRDRAILRSLSKIGSEIARDAFDPQGRTSEDLLDEAERKVLTISDHSATHREGFRSITPLLVESFNTLQALIERGNKNTLIGLPSGFVDLDNLTLGFQNGDLIIVAGRPSMGKTAFVLNIAEHVALKEEKTVALFSLEMSAEQLVLRLLSANTGVPAHKLRTGNLETEEWNALALSSAAFHNNKIYIDDTAGLTPASMRSRARRLKREVKDLGLVVIDYIQLMQGARAQDNRATEVSDISRSIKALARELNVPVIALSQLSRKVEERSDKRPVMSDLRESGAIEQDADLILMLFREEYYRPDDASIKGMVELIIGKQRNGPTGSVKLTFLGETMRFANFTSNDHIPPYAR